MLRKEHSVDPLVVKISRLARERAPYIGNYASVAEGLFVDVENLIARRLLENIAVVRASHLFDAGSYGFGVRYDPWRIFAEIGINGASQEGSKKIQSLKVSDITHALQKGATDPLQEGALVAIFESSVDYTDYLRARHPIPVRESVVTDTKPKSRFMIPFREIPSMFRGWALRLGKIGNEAA